MHIQKNVLFSIVVLAAGLVVGGESKVKRARVIVSDAVVSQEKEVAALLLLRVQKLEALVAEDQRILTMFDLSSAREPRKTRSRSRQIDADEASLRAIHDSLTHMREKIMQFDERAADQS